MCIRDPVLRTINMHEADNVLERNTVNSRSILPKNPFAKLHTTKEEPLQQANKPACAAVFRA